MEKFGITVTARLRHAVLFGLAKKLGSQAELARQLGVSQRTISTWINLRGCPPVTLDEARARDWSRGKLHWLEKRLFKLTGQTLDALFPVELRTNAKFLEAEKAIEETREIDLRLVGSSQRLLLPNPAEEVAQRLDDEALQKKIVLALGALPPRIREIMELRFGLNGHDPRTLEEVSSVIGVTRERVRQLEQKALSILRRPSQSAALAPHWLDREPYPRKYGKDPSE